jgi:malate synthase
VAKDIFDEHMKTPNQIHVAREDVHITAADLLAVPQGEITERGLRLNIDVGIQYLESWLRGSGCVPLYNLMEDAATAEISRTQVWQWIHHGATLNDGRAVTLELVRDTTASVLSDLRSRVGAAAYDAGKFPLAAQLFEEMMVGEELTEFLTLEAYRYL